MYLEADIKYIRIKITEQQPVILRDINFSLSPNKIYTILGENGSGKSTLIKSLTCLLPQNQYVVEGEVKLNSLNLFKASAEELIKIRQYKIRYVLQDSINSFDPLRKLGYYFNSRIINKNDIESLLDYFLLPEYEIISKMHPYELSGGMAQRLTVVLALAANPELLILDEPTSGIDYTLMNLTFLKLKDYVRQNENSVLLVTQDWNFALRISDYISLLSDGNLSQFYSASEFLTQGSNNNLLLVNTFRDLNQ